jgi:hypothetical protein
MPDREITYFIIRLNNDSSTSDKALHARSKVTSLILTFPVSTTYFTPGIVNEVSATFVAIMHKRVFSGGGLNTCVHNQTSTWETVSGEIETKLLCFKHSILLNALKSMLGYVCYLTMLQSPSLTMKLYHQLFHNKVLANAEQQKIVCAPAYSPHLAFSATIGLVLQLVTGQVWFDLDMTEFLNWHGMNFNVYKSTSSALLYHSMVQCSTRYTRSIPQLADWLAGRNKMVKHEASDNCFWKNLDLNRPHLHRHHWSMLWTTQKVICSYTSMFKFLLALTFDEAAWQQNFSN